MSKKLFLLALAPLAVSLFLPWQSAGLGGASVTEGLLAGTLTNPAYLMFLLPGLVAALLGAIGRGPVGRVRGVIAGVLALLTIALHATVISPERDAMGLSFAAGFYLSVAGAAVATVAGLSTLFSGRTRRKEAAGPVSAAA